MPGYPQAARQAVSEMNRQVGPLRFEADGLARRGLLVRHLVMPGMPEETMAILRYVAGELGAGTYVDLMAQYRPAWSAVTTATATTRSTGGWHATSMTAPPRSPTSSACDGSTSAAGHPPCCCPGHRTGRDHRSPPPIRAGRPPAPIGTRHDPIASDTTRSAYHALSLASAAHLGATCRQAPRPITAQSCRCACGSD
jgi:hypothetical protein